jgi:DedD protein
VLDLAFKQRLLGATVIVVLGVIFVPIVLDGGGLQRAVQTGIAEVPPRPMPPVPDIKPEPRVPPVVSELSVPPNTAELPPLPAEPVELPPLPTAASEPQSPTPVAAAEERGWIVQVASVSDVGKAKHLRERLIGGGFSNAYVESVQNNQGRAVYRVRVGPFGARAQADATKAKLAAQARIQAIVVKAERE